MRRVLLILLSLFVLMGCNGSNNNDASEQVAETIVRIKKETILQYNSIDKNPNKIIREYNESGYLLKELFYKPDGEKLMDATLTLNTNNELVEKVIIYPSVTSKYYKDENGKWWSALIYNSPYIEDVIKELSTIPTVEPFKDYAQYIMDNKRKNSEEVPYVEYQVEYNEYDDYGNWKKCSLIKKNEVIILQREIEWWGDISKMKKVQIVQSNSNASSLRDSLVRKNNMQDSLQQVKLNTLSKKFKKIGDDFSSNVWVKHNTAPNYVDCNSVHLYFSTLNDKAFILRFKLQYHSDDWLFINEVVFNIDGELYYLAPEKMERDNNGGYVWEWYDTYVGNDKEGVTEKFIKKLATAKSAKMKMIGSQYYNVRELTENELTALKETYEYFILLGGRI